jgi:hypothetical protein
MNDWIGLGFLVALGIGAFLGLRALSRPTVRSAEEFERNAAEGTTALGAGMNALQELLTPEAAKAREVQMQMKDGRYLKKRREGKADGDDPSQDLSSDEG